MDYQHIERWKRPSNYGGAEWHEYYGAGVHRNRDSGVLERANFDAMKAALETTPEPADWDKDEPAWTVVTENHWAVGWVEWIAIHEDHVTALKLADRIMGRMESSCVIDEDLLSQYEDEECAEVWEKCYSERERAQYIREHVREVYPLPGETPYTMLRHAVKGDWSYAANLLPCPSDLID
jgi:hypothetical protein